MSLKTLQRACFLLASCCQATGCHSPPDARVAHYTTTSAEIDASPAVLYGAADEAKLRWLRGPGEPGSDSAPQVAALCEFLRHCDGATDHRAVAAVLDRLRTLGAGASGAGETLSDLLGHRSSLYRDRDKIQVVRLRSYILVTLSDIGVPRSSEPLLADAIEHCDERLMAVEI